ncbi:MAG: 3'-5' exonuclease, partial [Bacteroidota bacterium]
LDTNEDRIVQLSTRLVALEGFQDYNHLVRPNGFTIPDTVTSIHGITDQVATRQGISLEKALKELLQQIEQADIIVGHHIDFGIAILLAEARRTGFFDLVATLTHPKFGLDAGRRAAICTQRLAADYFRFLGESPSLSDTKLATVYRRLFGEELVGAHDAMVDVVACQRVYDQLHGFQLEHGLDFPADIVCFED